jgi:hypothetical protein
MHLGCMRAGMKKGEGATKHPAALSGSDGWFKDRLLGCDEGSGALCWHLDSVVGAPLQRPARRASASFVRASFRSFGIVHAVCGSVPLYLAGVSSGAALGLKVRLGTVSFEDGRTGAGCPNTAPVLYSRTAPHSLQWLLVYLRSPQG